MDKDKKGIGISFEKYPYAGDGYRWYDYLHNFILWLLSDWKRKFFPKFIRKFRIMKDLLCIFLPKTRLISRVSGQLNFSPYKHKN